MKQLFIIALALMPLLQQAQTIVSTEPQNKNVVLEKYTGIHCGFCPDGDVVAHSIANQYPDRVILISIHTGVFANPSSGEPDFRTPFGSALAQQAGVTGFPAGSVNRHVFPGSMTPGKTALGRSNWAAASGVIVSQPSCVNIGGTATIDPTTRNMVVNVEAYYTANCDAAINKINVVLLQDSTVGPQAGGGSNYVHNNRLIHMLTGQWGETINITTEGTLYQNKFTYKIPEAHNQIPIVLSKLRLAIFISEGKEEIYTGINVIPQLVQLPATDYIVSYRQPLDFWDSSITPEISMKTVGTESITAMNFKYKVNSQAEQTYNWEGTANFGQTVDITLPEITFEPNNVNLLQITPVTADGVPANNPLTVYLQPAILILQTDVVVEVKPDRQGHQIKWFIKSEDGSIVAQGGNYPPGNVTIKEHEVSTGEGNFYLEIKDMGEDGIHNGYVKLKTGDSTLIEIPGNSFFDIIKRKFTARNIYTIDITPTSGTTSASGSGPYTITSTCSLFTMAQEPIDADNVYTTLKLNKNDINGAELGYTATVSSDKKQITIVPDDVIPVGTVVFLEFAGKSEEGYLLKKSSTFTVGTGSNITESSSDAISLFPNPARTQFTVSGIEHGEVRIYTVSGQLIVNEQINANEPVILPNNRKGVLLVKITTDNKSIVKQLVVE